MERVGYAPAAWAGFGGALAAVAGALTGLLFVALSVKGAALSESPPLNARAAQTLTLFMTSVMIALTLAAPQPATAIGSELLALAVLAGVLLFVLDRRAGHARQPGVARFVERYSPNTITALLIGIAGVSLIVQAGGGLFWLIPAVAAALLGGVANTWIFLVRLPS